MMASSSQARVTHSAAMVVLALALACDALAQESTETQTPPSAANSAEEAIELKRMSVTGTRVRRGDVEGALPVTVISRETIDLSGETSLSDLIRNLSFNSFGSEPSRFQGDPGVSVVNLRGLGSSRTLILVDGRRLPKAPTSTAYQNLANIPLSSVERVEILTDGASAIYGSDAIGGVINIITRRDYTGWELMYGHAEPQYGKGKRDQASYSGTMLPEPARGAAAVRQHMADTAPFIESFSIEETVIENQAAAVLVRYEAVNGVQFEGCYFLDAGNGLITRIRTVFDSRPLMTGGPDRRP